MRMPPCEIEAEMSVLGAMLLGDAGACAEAGEILFPDDFYRDTHSEIFDAMQAVLADDKPVDPVTLKDELIRRGNLEWIGGMGYILQLGEIEFTTANIRYYADIVKDRALRRRLIETAGQIAARAYGTDEIEVPPAAQQIDDAERSLFALSEDIASGNGPEQAAEPMKRFLSDLMDRKNSGGGFRGTATGFNDLDRTLNGMRPANLYILAARPSMGKTAMCGSLLVNIAKTGTPVVFFSLEMPADDLMMRFVSSEARINSDRLQLADFDGQQNRRIADAARLVQSLPLYIDDESDLTATQIEARTRRILNQHQSVGLVVVDYLQIMGTPTQRENRNVEVGMAAKSLKAMSKRLNIPVMALSQLSRANERRPDKTPVMSDLRESGDIEQVADAIIFLHRPSYYDNQAAPVQEGEYDKTELHIPKNRNGRTGQLNLGFSPHFTRFESLAPDYFTKGF